MSIDIWHTLKISCLTLVPVALLAGAATAQTGHYQPGSNGMNSAALPQDRAHSFKTLTGLYITSEYARDDGSTGGIDADIEVLFGSIRYRFMSGWKLLGGSYGFALDFIFAEADFNTPNPDIQDGPLGVGDPGVSPLILGWESGHLHGMLEYTFFMPVGRYDEDAVDNVGNGHWSHLFSLGGSGHVGADSTWSGTLIARYELNTQLEDRDIKPGDDIVLEAMLGKRLWGLFDIGAVGYGVWQITDDSGSALSPEDQGKKSSVMAAGIELALCIPDQPVEIRWRTYSQFYTRNRLRGSESILDLYFYF